jgi:hypothetical protein
MARVRYPALAKQIARFKATVVLPHPPLALVSVKTFDIKRLLEIEKKFGKTVWAN